MQTQKLAAEIPATSLERHRRPRAFEMISAARTAHLIVDMQNGFVEPGAPVEVPFARLIMPNVNRIIREVRRSGGRNIFLRFTHDPGEAMPWIIPDALRQGPKGELVRKAFARGTDYWQLSGDLDVGADDLILDKTRYKSCQETAKRHIPLTSRVLGFPRLAADTVIGQSGKPLMSGLRAKNGYS